MDDHELEDELAELEELECDELLSDLPAPGPSAVEAKVVSAKPMSRPVDRRGGYESDSDASQNYYEEEESLDEEDLMMMMM